MADYKNALTRHYTPIDDLNPSGRNGRHPSDLSTFVRPPRDGEVNPKTGQPYERGGEWPYVTTLDEAKGLVLPDVARVYDFNRNDSPLGVIDTPLADRHTLGRRRESEVYEFNERAQRPGPLAPRIPVSNKMIDWADDALDRAETPEEKLEKKEKLRNLEEAKARGEKVKHYQYDDSPPSVQSMMMRAWREDPSEEMYNSLTNMSRVHKIRPPWERVPRISKDN